MTYILLLLTFATPCIAMQTAGTFSATESALFPTQTLKRYGQEIALIRSSLWPINGLLVRYNNIGPNILNDQQALDCHRDNIKRAHSMLITECEYACHALSNSNLSLLIQHTQNAQRLFAQLQKEATHFKIVIEKKVPHSNM